MSPIGMSSDVTDSPDFTHHRDHGRDPRTARPYPLSTRPLGIPSSTRHQAWAIQFDRFWTFSRLVFRQRQRISIAHLAILFYCAAIDPRPYSQGIGLILRRNPGISSLGALHPASDESPEMLALASKSSIALMLFASRLKNRRPASPRRKRSTQLCSTRPTRYIKSVVILGAIRAILSKSGSKIRAS